MQAPAYRHVSHYYACPMLEGLILPFSLHGGGGTAKGAVPFYNLVERYSLSVTDYYLQITSFLA